MRPVHPRFAPPPATPIPDATTIGAVHLTVADLARSVDFYRRAVGLQLLWTEDGSAALGAGGRELVVVCEVPGARPVRGTTGLFHLALLLPERADLARWLLHAVRDEVRLTGLSDHFVSEAVYLDDPDGHGIELYADRARNLWEGEVAERVVVEPLDTRALIASLDDVDDGFDAVPPSTRMGHVHLRVSSMVETRTFYLEVLGFALMGALGAEAAFFGAGGYHHQVGVNVWGGAGASPAAAGSASLIKATILAPDVTSRDLLATRAAGAGGLVEPTAAGVLLRDPSGLALELVAATE